MAKSKPTTATEKNLEDSPYTNLILHAQLESFRLWELSIRVLRVMCFGGSRRRVSSVDSFKCQTTTVSPAGLGDYLFYLIL